MRTRAFWAVGLALAAVLWLPSFATGGTTERVSVDSEGNQANGTSSGRSISADGRFVAFGSTASNIVPSDANGTWDIFIRDRGTATTNPSTRRVSIATDGGDPNAYSGLPVISADGQSVAFESQATNLVAGDRNGFMDVFVWEAATGKITRISVASDGTEANGDSGMGGMTPDGQRVVFWSDATNLVAGGTTAGTRNVFVHDRVSGETTLVSVAADGGLPNGSSDFGSISANGRFVAFVSYATNLVAGDTNGVRDAFVRDLLWGVTRRVSVASDGTQANGESRYGTALSADGRYVAFCSGANNLVPGSNKRPPFSIYVHDQQEGRTTLVSVSSDGTPGNRMSWYPRLSADGRNVAFSSQADNLVPADTNGTYDVFVHDRLIGQTTRVNVASDGTQANGTVLLAPAISADGRFVAFDSGATNLVPGDTNGVTDTFIHDRGAAPPPPTEVHVDKVSYATAGTRGRDLRITVALLDDLANPVPGASVSIDVSLGGQSYASRTGITGADGTVAFTLKSAPSGTYTTTVTAVIAAGLLWDGLTPANEFTK